MKKPKQLRDDIRALTRHLTQVREVLLKRSDVEIAQIGKECKRTADSIGELLKTQELPNDYKVAVVGRFKTGKSSFVNELLGAKLANEDTNPENSAITTFKHGSKVVATVSFAAQEEWAKLKQLHAEDPKHVDAHRVKMWESFGKPKKSKDGTIKEAIRPKALELKYVKPGGYKLQIDLSEDRTKKSETEFQHKLKEFTSGAKPHHCLVQALKSLRLLPSSMRAFCSSIPLDDTERFRVSLTEKTVEDVDAVLFLLNLVRHMGSRRRTFCFLYCGREQSSS